MHNETANYEMIALAREVRGLTQSDLARSLGVSQGKVSKFEIGLLSPSPQDIRGLAKVLNYPEAFFFQRGSAKPVGSACLYHRKRQSMPVIELRRIQAKIAIVYLQMRKLLHGAEIETENKFHRMDVDEYKGPEEVASLLRKSWGIQSGPVENMAQTIESAGGIVFRWSFGTRKLDAISQWASDMPPLIFVNAEAPTDRIRFSLAHELGHLIMHRTPTPDQEREADRFASEFLMPAMDIKPHLQPLSIAKAAALKPYWKVSMAAIIKRAFDLGVIRESYYRKLFTQLSTLGYKMSEPSPLPSEEPTVCDEIIKVYFQNHKYTLSDMSRLVLLHEDEFRAMYLHEEAKKLRLVQ